MFNITYRQRAVQILLPTDKGPDPVCSSSLCGILKVLCGHRVYGAIDLESETLLLRQAMPMYPLLD